MDLQHVVLVDSGKIDMKLQGVDLQGAKLQGAM